MKMKFVPPFKDEGEVITAISVAGVSLVLSEGMEARVCPRQISSGHPTPRVFRSGHRVKPIGFKMDQLVKLST
jgi:hypothetical protein